MVLVSSGLGPLGLLHWWGRWHHSLRKSIAAGEGGQCLPGCPSPALWPTRGGVPAGGGWGLPGDAAVHAAACPPAPATAAGTRYLDTFVMGYIIPAPDVM